MSVFDTHLAPFFYSFEPTKQQIMKKHIIAVLSFLVIAWHISIAQQLDFEVQYHLSTVTTYEVSEADISSLLPQDTIKLLPEHQAELVHEQFFEDGSFTIESHISYPMGLLESWIKPIDKVVTTSDRITTYINDSVVYEEDVTPTTEAEPNESFAPFYLATNNWQLPLSTVDVAEYQQSGFDILENTSTRLSIKNGEVALVYDKSNWSETLIQFDEYDNEISRKATFYTPNNEGYLVYDVILTRSIDARTTPCLIKTTYEKYTDITRIFHNPQCAPSLENGFSSARMDTLLLNRINVYQIEGTNSLLVNYPTTLPDHLVGEIKDLYGNVVVDNLPLVKDDPYVSVGQLPTGVYHFSLKNQPIIPCKFLFQP